MIFGNCWINAILLREIVNMFTNQKRKQATQHLFQTLLKHVWNLLELCYKEKQTLKVCNITISLRILIFNIQVLQNKVINIDGDWSYYGKYHYAGHSTTLEKLELKLKVSKNAHANFTKLKKKKVLEFCLHFRLTVNEFEEYIKLNNDSENCYVKKVFSKILKLRKRMLQTLNVESHKWVKHYSRILKHYKSHVTFMSTLLSGCKNYLSQHPHYAFLSTIEITG